MDIFNNVDFCFFYAVEIKYRKKEFTYLFIIIGVMKFYIIWIQYLIKTIFQSTISLFLQKFKNSCNITLAINFYSIVIQTFISPSAINNKCLKIFYCVMLSFAICFLFHCLLTTFLVLVDTLYLQFV